jgi:GAF domain-containing protein
MPESYALLPLMAGGEAIGTFYVAWAEPRSFDAEEFAFLEAIAAEATMGLENARLYEAERQAQERAQAELQTAGLLLETTEAATSLADFGRTLESFGDLLLRATDHARVLVELWDEERQEIEIGASRGAEATANRRFALRDLSEAAWEVIATRTTTVADYAATDLPAPQKQYVDEHAFLLVLLVPIVHHERLVGPITVDQPGERRPFSAREIQLVGTRLCRPVA